MFRVVDAYSRKTKKLGCRAMIVISKQGENWKLQSVDLQHNHEAYDIPAIYRRRGYLTSDVTGGFMECVSDSAEDETVHGSNVLQNLLTSNSTHITQQPNDNEPDSAVAKTKPEILQGLLTSPLEDQPRNKFVVLQSLLAPSTLKVDDSPSSLPPEDSVECEDDTASSLDEQPQQNDQTAERHWYSYFLFSFPV